MKIITNAMLAAGALALGTQAHAFGNQPAPEFYVGGQYSFQQLKPDFGSDLDFDTFAGRAGVQINPYLSGEFRAGFGVSGDSGVDMNYFYGFYGRAGLANDTQFTPYLLVGWNEVEFEVGNNKMDMDGLAYGIGLDFNLDRHLALNAEFVRMLDKDFGDFDSVNLGVTYSF